jgi:hypothetical protein
MDPRALVGPALCRDFYACLSELKSRCTKPLVLRKYSIGAALAVLMPVVSRYSTELERT